MYLKDADLKPIPLKGNIYQNTIGKQDTNSRNFVEANRSITNVQTFIKEKNKIAPMTTSDIQEPIIIDAKSDTIYGYPKMYVYGAGAVIGLGLIYLLTKR